MTKDQMTKVQVTEVTAVNNFQRHPVKLHDWGMHLVVALKQ